MGLILGCWKW